MGLEPMQQQLVQCISTLIPSFQYNGVVSTNNVYNQRKCSGIVLHGPSGSGKTALSDWLAHITRRHCRFLSVPCADLVHKVVGETERKLSEIFQAARELSPCIVLLDNIDMLLGASDTATTSDCTADTTSDSTGDTPSNTIPTLSTEPYSDSVTTAPRGDPGNSITRDRPGRRKLVRKNQPSRPQRDLLPPPPGVSQPSHSQRSQFRSSRTRHQAVDRMLSTLLVEIDGIYTTSSSPHSSSSSSGRSSSQTTTPLLSAPSVLVIATTATMSCMDRALVRPGRLEEHIALSLPSCAQRQAYILHLLHSHSQQQQQQQVPADSMAETSELDLSGSGLSDRMTECAVVCSKATEGRSYAHIQALYQEANIAYARGLLSSGKGLIALQAAQYGEKLEFIINYMTDHTASISICK